MDDVLILIDQQKAMEHAKWGPRNNADAERKHIERRNVALSKLGRSLSAAETPEGAARIIIDVADELLGIERKCGHDGGP